MTPKAMNDPTDCPVCFFPFERGQRVTYLPCQLNRITELVASANIKQLPQRNASYIGSQVSRTLSNNSQCDTEIEGLITFQSKGGNLDKQHLFHYDCLYQWFEASKRCPICNLVVGNQFLKVQEMDVPPLARSIFKEF